MPSLPRGGLFGRCSDSAKTFDQGRQVPQAGTLGRQTDRQGFRQVSTVTMRFVFQYPLSPQLNSEAHLQLLHTVYTDCGTEEPGATHTYCASASLATPNPTPPITIQQGSKRRPQLAAQNRLRHRTHRLRHREYWIPAHRYRYLLSSGGKRGLRPDFTWGLFHPNKTFFTVPLVMSRQYRVSRQPVTTQPTNPPQELRDKKSPHTRDELATLT